MRSACWLQKIANSRYANNTLIFVVEDDAQDGGDHVDSHRSIAFVAGAYVKQGSGGLDRSTTPSTSCARWKRFWACRR